MGHHKLALCACVVKRSLIFERKLSKFGKTILQATTIYIGYVLSIFTHLVRVRVLNMRECIPLLIFERIYTVKLVLTGCAWDRPICPVWTKSGLSSFE
jgi:hypothetical protein